MCSATRGSGLGKHGCPNFFQSGCLGDVVVNYRVQDDASIEVVNGCRAVNGKVSQVQGRAVAAEGDTTNTRLKVSLLFRCLQWVPFSQGNDWVVMLDSDYCYAAVSEPSLKYLWVLSRVPVMDNATYDFVMVGLKLKGYPVADLVRTSLRP